MFRTFFLVVIASLLGLPGLSQGPLTEQVTVDARAVGTPFPHFWEQMFGSGRAVLTLRDSYRQDLEKVKAATDFKYVRFHAILADEVGVYNEDAAGQPIYNWSYVDQIYDGLLARGVRPFVEISFTPKKLASDPAALHFFWYKPNVSPPADYGKWDALMTAFARHLVDRYGIDEVSSWYFEVWNEPNIDFWVGTPKQSTYFTLYDHTARALKAVNPRLRVGGPATAQAAWVDAMIAHAAAGHVPLDFVSTHVYGDDVTADVFADKRYVAPHEMVAAAVAKVHEQIVHSAMPELPLIWSEYNATYTNTQAITDSIYMGPWMARNIRQCDGLTQMMSYWTFSDVFEELGVVKTPFYGGYGLIAELGIPKPAFLVFELLHTLGETRLASTSPDLLVTRRADGTLEIAVWNMAEPPGSTVPERSVAITLEGEPATAVATVRRVDAAHGDTLGVWKGMGSPAYPTRAQVEELKRVGTLGAAEPVGLAGGRMVVRVPSSGLAVMEVRRY